MKTTILSAEKYRHGTEYRYTFAEERRCKEQHKHRHRYLDTNEGVHQIEKFARGSARVTCNGVWIITKPLHIRIRGGCL